MSLYKTPKSPYYQYDFQIRGHRFFGSSGKADRREAKGIEDAEKIKARAEVERAEKTGGKGPLTLDIAAGRYWAEVGIHHAAPETTMKNLSRLLEYFGKEKRLEDITGNDVAALVARRRSDTIRDRKTIRDPQNAKLKIPAPKISPSTVNRSTIEPLQKIFNRAKNLWGQSFSNEPRWNDLLLKEPEERVREVRSTEESALEGAIREDYRPVIEFARASGLRMKECLLKKDQVHLREEAIETIGKGGRIVRRPITGEMRAILVTAMQNPTEWVFTYKAVRAHPLGKIAKGDHLPVTPSGLKTIWRRARSRKGEKIPPDLRFHDMRHDFATTLLRSTGNLKIVQKALGHARIETTSRYAHVTDDDLREGMEKAAKVRQGKRLRKDRKKPA